MLSLGGDVYPRDPESGLRSPIASRNNMDLPEPEAPVKRLHAQPAKRATAYSLGWSEALRA